MEMHPIDVKYSQEVRTLIYTSNTVEGFQCMLRKFTKAKSIFPLDDAVRKSVYLSVQEIIRKRTIPIRDCRIIIWQPFIFFGDRFLPASQPNPRCEGIEFIAFFRGVGRNTFVFSDMGEEFIFRAK